MKIIKKFLIIIFMIILLFSLTGCETKEEREAREAQEAAIEAKHRYEDAKLEAIKTQQAIDDYKKALEELEKFK